MNEPAPLTMDDAILYLRKVVPMKGADYRYRDEYDRCYYVGEDNQPMCIVGHVLDVAGRGFGFDDLRNSVMVCSLADDKLMDDKASEVFRAAQAIQDDAENPDNTWGDALENAELRYKELGGTL